MPGSRARVSSSAARAREPRRGGIEPARSSRRSPPTRCAGHDAGLSARQLAIVASAWRARRAGWTTSLGAGRSFRTSPSERGDRGAARARRQIARLEAELATYLCDLPRDLPTAPRRASAHVAKVEELEQPATADRSATRRAACRRAAGKAGGARESAGRQSPRAGDESVAQALTRALLPAKSFFEEVGEMMILTARTIASAVRPPYPYGEELVASSSSCSSCRGSR